MDYANFLSDQLKERLYACKLDLEFFIQRGDSNGNIMKIMVLEIDELLDKYALNPIPICIANKIHSIELFVYSKVMTNEVYNQIIEENKFMDEQEEKLIEMMQHVDYMWEENKTEDEIKLFLRDKINIIFPQLDEDCLTDFTDSFYISFTYDKNVRIFLTDEQISDLKREKYDDTRQSRSNNNITCGTCLDEFVKGDELIVLHDSHKFHPECIIPWLKKSVKCPTCRFDLREK